MQYKAEAAMIVDALLNSDEMGIAKNVAASGPRQLGHAQTRPGGAPAGRKMRLPYHSRQQGKTLDMDADLEGDVAVFKGDHDQYVARNLRTQRAHAHPDRTAALRGAY